MAPKPHYFRLHYGHVKMIKWFTPAHLFVAGISNRIQRFNPSLNHNCAVLVIAILVAFDAINTTLLPLIQRSKRYFKENLDLDELESNRSLVFPNLT